MPRPRTIPALADLTRDIAGPLPLDVLREWAAGAPDARRAGELLDPFRIAGTVVATDAAALSAMTGERDLVDVLALVAAPRKIVHAVGGRSAAGPRRGSRACRRRPTRSRSRCHH